MTNVHSTYYLLGSALGPHPYPVMVRDFHRVIGEETRAEILKREGRLPDSIFACVGGGSNAIGMFHAFIGDENVKLIGVEAGGRSEKLGEHAARFSGGSPGALQGAYSYLLQDDDGQVSLTHSISAGLDYALVGPEHAWLHDRHRAEYTSCSDKKLWPRRRGWRARKELFRRSNPRTPSPKRSSARPRSRARLFIVNLSGRGDKDTDIYRENLTGTRCRPESSSYLSDARAKASAALIAYLTAGDPSAERRPDWSPRSNGEARI